MRRRSTIEPSDVTAIIDNREQLPLDLSPLRTTPGTLQTGDYSCLGLEDEIAIERKSMADLISCVGVERERFERELKRLQAFAVRAVIVEATWSDLQAGQWRSKVTATAAVGSVLAWVGDGIPFLFVGNHHEAGRVVARLLFVTARRRWRSLQAFQGGLKIAADAG